MIDDFSLYKGMWIQKKCLASPQKLTKGECKSLLRRGGLLVRDVYNWDKVEECSFWYVIKDDYKGMEELPTKVRNQVRKSLKTYEFRKVSYEEMLFLGYELFNQSRERFGRELEITKEEWDRRIRGKHQQLWLGFDRESGRPASFAINTLYEKYCDYTTMGFNPQFPNSTYPIYGLIYEMNRYYLENQRVSFVCDGVRSITEHSNIQEFLIEKFKFRKAYCDIQLYYRPLLALAVNMLFPFRKWINNKKVSAALYQEAMARNLV